LLRFCTSFIAVWRKYRQHAASLIPEQGNRLRYPMKPRPLPALLLASLVATAQEPNPFLIQPNDESPPPEASGESFVQVVEHLVVPANMIDRYLVENPVGDDASALRARVQEWAAEGQAKLDQTSVVVGTVGRDASAESIFEQIYATEYIPPEPGEWSLPTAFECRNVGYSVQAGAAAEAGRLMLRSKLEVVRMLPSRAWNDLAEKTRQPTDVFIPRFRSIGTDRQPAKQAAAQANADPFAAPDPFGRNFRDAMPRYAPGKIHLALRVDDDLPEPTIAASPEAALAAGQRSLPADRPVRLIFFRGDVAAAPASGIARISENCQLSVRLVSVAQPLLSEWLQEQEISAVPAAAWPVVAEWIKAESASIFRDLSGTCEAGAAVSLSEIVEYSYPTEWEPGDSKTDGKGVTIREASSPTAFETRHTGSNAQVAISSDPSGSLLKLSVEHVLHVRDTVHHRLLREGEWKEDIKFPLFGTLRIETELRPVRGQWMLAGSGAAIGADGRFDASRSVLAFVKVE
jgi:hypothetical protein